MSDEPVPDETLLAALEGRGYDVAALRQQKKPEPPTREDVQSWVSEAVSEALGAQGQGSAGQPTDQQAEALRFAERQLDALNKSRTPWFSWTGEEEPPDAA